MGEREDWPPLSTREWIELIGTCLVAAAIVSYIDPGGWAWTLIRVVVIMAVAAAGVSSARYPERRAPLAMWYVAAVTAFSLLVISNN